MFKSIEVDNDKYQVLSVRGLPEGYEFDQELMKKLDLVPIQYENKYLICRKIEDAIIIESQSTKELQSGE